MGVPDAIYSWSTVKALRVIVLSMNWAGLFVVVVTIVWAVKLELGFANFLNLVSTGDGHLWSIIIIVTASICLPIYVFGVRTCLKIYTLPEERLKYLNDSTEDEAKIHDEEEEINRDLFFYSVLCVCSGCLVIIMNFICYFRSDIFQHRIRDGLIGAIENYGIDVVKKSQIDTLQINLGCCGSNNYKDWFRVPWSRPDTETDLDDQTQEIFFSGSQKNEDILFFSSDVPFSCCSTEILQPCIHHDLRVDDHHGYIRAQKLTINTDGCRDKIISRGRTIAYFLTAFLMLLASYQFVLALFSRLLQTAYSNEFYIGPEKEHYYVWLLGEGLKEDEKKILLPRVIDKRKEMRSNKNCRASSSSLSRYIENNNKVYVYKNKENTENRRCLRRIYPRFISTDARHLLRTASIATSNSSADKKINLSKSYDRIKAERKSTEFHEKSRTKINIPEKNNIESSHSLHKFVSPKSSAVAMPPAPPPFPTENQEKRTIDTRENDREVLRKNTCECGSPAKEQCLLRLTRTADVRKNVSLTSSARGSIRRYSSRQYRRKLLQKFGNVWNNQSLDTRQRREPEGSDALSGVTIRHRESLLIKGKKKNTAQNKAREDIGEEIDPDHCVRSKFNSADAYDRFRGSLQNTLARREIVKSKIRAIERTRRHNRGGVAKVDGRKSKLIARLACSNDFPPSYRLLASFEGLSLPPLRALPPRPPPSPPPLPPSGTQSPEQFPRPTVIFQRELELRRRQQRQENRDPQNFDRKKASREVNSSDNNCQCSVCGKFFTELNSSKLRDDGAPKECSQAHGCGRKN